MIRVLGTGWSLCQHFQGSVEQRESTPPTLSAAREMPVDPHGYKSHREGEGPTAERGMDRRATAPRGWASPHPESPTSSITRPMDGTPHTRPLAAPEGGGASAQALTPRTATQRERREAPPSYQHQFITSQFQVCRTDQMMPLPDTPQPGLGYIFFLAHVSGLWLCCPTRQPLATCCCLN